MPLAIYPAMQRSYIFNRLVDDSFPPMQSEKMAHHIPKLDATFAALADPTRRAILTRLLDGDLPVGTLAEPFDLTLAAVSKHLQILMRANLVTTQKRGREKWCSLNPDAIAPAAQWIEAFGAWGSEDFDRMEAAIAPLLGTA